MFLRERFREWLREFVFALVTNSVTMQFITGWSVTNKTFT